LIMIPTLLTGWMAWKTIDVDAAYSEAKWIFALMLVQCQARKIDSRREGLIVMVATHTKNCLIIGHYRGSTNAASGERSVC
jgi:predicted small integral membrane protein